VHVRDKSIKCARRSLVGKGVELRSAGGLVLERGTTETVKRALGERASTAQRSRKGQTGRTDSGREREGETERKKFSKGGPGNVDEMSAPLQQRSSRGDPREQLSSDDLSTLAGKKRRESRTRCPPIDGYQFPSEIRNRY